MASRKPRGFSPVRRNKPAVEPAAPPDLTPASVSEQKLNAYRKKRYGVLHPGGPALEKRRAEGKLTARERIDALLDEGSFVELDIFATHRAHGFGMEERRIAGDGVVSGFGQVGGRDVAVYAYDATVLGGSLGEVTAEKIIKVQDLALRNRIPIVGINDSGGARILPRDEAESAEMVRRLLSYLPSSNEEQPPFKPTADDFERADEELQTLVPESPNLPYDMREVIVRLLDDRQFMEVQPFFAQNIVVGLGRLGGHTVGLVGNQPKVLAGAIDIKASVKAARFIRFCDAFNIPVIALVDVPGYLPGTAQEHEGIIRHGAKLLYAYAEATVPKLTVITRKDYGGAYCVMGPKQMGA